MIEKTFLNPTTNKQWRIEIDGHTIRTCLNGGKVKEILCDSAFQVKSKAASAMMGQMRKGFVYQNPDAAVGQARCHRFVGKDSNGFMPLAAALTRDDFFLTRVVGDFEDETLYHFDGSGEILETVSLGAKRMTYEHPMDEDKDYEYENRYKLTTTPEDDPIHFTPNYTTIKMHLNREPRFYAYIGFDGGKWFSIECCNDNETSSYPIKSKKGDIAGVSDELYSPTGYFTKKLVSYQNVNTSATNINYVYSFPIIRLSDLYLLYAEALNELNETPTTDVYYYVQQVRNKAGLDEGGSLVNTWRNHSNRPDKPTTQRGMREIIQKERMIELAFEGHRYHDVRRWKLGSTYLNTQIKGWSVLEQDPEYFYNARVLFTRKFMPRDYLWPIKTNSINRNPKLVQNPQW